MMQPSPDPPYGMPPTAQMRGMSLGPRPPLGAGAQVPGYGPPLTSNTGLPQSNFSMNTGQPISMATGPAPQGQISAQPPRQYSGPPSRHSAPSMSGPPPSMSGPPPSMSGPPPTMSGPPPSMTGPPPSMSGGPPPSMTGPLPSMSGPPPSMTGPPPSMSGPPPSMTGPPPSMSGGPPPSMSGQMPQSIVPPQGPPTSMMGGPFGQMVSGNVPPPPTMTRPPGLGPTMTRPPGPGSTMTGPPGQGPPTMTGPPGQGHSFMTGLPGQGPPTMTVSPGQGPPTMTGPPGHGPPTMTGPPGQGPPMSLMTGPPPPRQTAPGGGYQLQPGMGGYPRQPGPPGSTAGLPTAPGGVQQGQPRARIDPDQMPNPVAVMRADQETRGGVPYLTSSRGNPPPLVTTQFRAQDDGNCSPRYLRSTMYTVPCTKDLLNGCKVPMGLVVQPLANIPPEENVLQLVDHGSSGPLRCNRCKAYMNPYARFIDGGRQYLCPVCQCSNEVPPEYFSHLDHQGRRTDVLQRPELRFGSVEYVATKDYCKEGKMPLPPAYIFMIDVSYTSVQSGLVSLLSQTILSILDQLPGSTDERASPIQVGFVTYDKVIHFYNVKASLAQPQMMVLTDISDVFVPMVDGFLVGVAEARTMLESFLSQLPDLFGSNKLSQVILEPVVRAGMEALRASGRNGRLFVFHSSLPTAPGPGVLKNRLDPKLLGTDKEKTLLSPVGSAYQRLSEECVKCGVGVELFLFPNSYCDTATLAKFASTTGGELHFYKNYQTSHNGEQLIGDLRHSVSRNTGFDAVMRVRASTGLRPTGFYGAFLMNNTTDIELGNVDADKAVAVEIKHDDKLREDEIAFFQAALLYTDVFGQRRLRVHNIAMNCSTKYQDIFRSCEIDCLMSFFSKSIIQASLSMTYKSIRDNFTHQCAVILSCYRKHCSSQSPPGQLILPESLKLLPMYANCLLKSDALLAPPVVTLDEKCWLMYLVLSMATTQVGSFIYPRVYALHDVNVEEKALPPLLRCTGQKLAESGAYLVENGLVTVVWLGQHLPLEFISKVFGVGSLAQVNPDLHALPALDNPLSFRVRGIIAQLQARRQHSTKLVISKQRDKTEVHFRRQLKEDKGAGQWEGTSYIDFLCNIHREIKEILS